MTKYLTGIIVSVGKIPNTVTVQLESFRKHRLYKKIVKKTSKILVDCQDSEIKLGDKVKINQTRPISKNKHFKVVGVIK